VLPLYWSFASGENSYWHLIPFYGIHREGDWYRKTFVFGPLFMDTRDSRAGLSQQDALLWLYSRRVEREKKLSWLFPVYYHRSDADSLLTLALPVLPYYHHREPDREKLSIIPVYSMRREKTYTEHASFWPLIRFGRDPEHDIALDQFLLYYHKREKDNSFATVFPLFWSTAEGAKKQQLLIPLYYHHEDADSLLTLAPLYYHRREDGTNTLYFWPFYRWHEQGSYQEHAFLWPLIRFGRDPERDIELDQFLLYYHKRERANSFTTVFPLYGRKVEGPEKKTWLIPLYYSQRDADSLLTLAPLYYHRKEPGSDSLHLWPLFSRHEQGSYREYGTLYPLIRFGRDPEREIALEQFLLYYHKRERANSFTTVFPLYGRKVEGPEKKTWLIPLYYSQSDADSLLTLAPLYYHRREPGMNTLYVWPFYRWHEEGAYQEHAFLWPLIRFGRDPVQDVELDQFLLYYHTRERTASFSTFFPVWWHQEKDENRRDLTLFLHWYERDAVRDETELSVLWLVPQKISLFHYNRRGAVVQHRLFPLYSYSSDRDRDAMSWSVLWLLFSYSSEGEFVQQTGFLWKVISYERKDAETSDFRFLWRVIRKSGTATSSIFEFNPFYYYESEEETGTYWAILGGLIGVETTPENKKKFRLFWVF
jgi:hypothetical protein